MTMALNLSKTVVDILKRNPGKYFTARQLAEWIWARLSGFKKK